MIAAAAASNVETQRPPKTRKGKKHLESIAPQWEEPPKGLLVIHGHQTSQQLKNVLTDLSRLKKPHCKQLRKKNDILPFETGGEASLEFLCKRNDCSLFILGNHTKKRPNNLILGRLYDFHLLDMFELGIIEYKGLEEFEMAKQLKSQLKPLVCFVGDFDSDDASRKLKNLFLDLFHDFEDRQISLEQLDNVIVISLYHDRTLSFQNFIVRLKKSDTYLPRVALEEAGPCIRFSLRRYRLAADDLWKQATKRPKQRRSQRNVTMQPILGRKVGRIHIGRQKLDQLVIKKQRALKRSKEQK
ncbi:Ribosome production factor 2 [Galdieria sulphuraria]|uniref:Ribosome production factor 2 homolog n=1 Tax=Galdieria sulphuraria TaxID=130081 RepID=M2XHD6_GALSU|nr:brix domain-containing protein [Galdieria sulphuraria]EME29492.1 brix domain-containing protein [Galdieria sulphuraria]GJD05989.1 Ribosome production factor 2 [Galdieria sulphuraria]|eukprot:XP_005706012.1 brix domain-containing protein [Galdieria sulphuraria]